MKQWLSAVLIGLGLTFSSHAALKVMAIGDSMTEEYHLIESIFFSAPLSNPTEANTMNWVEILLARRAADISFGGYKDGLLLTYSDYRNSGYEYNWGIPGYDTDMWMEIIHATNPIEDPVEFISRVSLIDQYDEVDVVVIMLGGNDVRSRYAALYNSLPGGGVATTFISTVTANLEDIIDEIRGVNSTVPIVLANIPDLGATPDKITAHPDPVKRANATAIINDLNVTVAALATSKGVTLAPISELTDAIISPDPLYIGAIEMIKGKDPENPPSYLFCREGLHPSTNGQSVIANTLLAAINTATGSSIPLLPDREVITHLLGLNPDQPFIDWAGSKGLTDLSMTADKDGDGIPSLGEYLLNLDPSVANDMHIANVQNILTLPTMILGYTLNTAAARLADINIKQSTNLEDWDDVPAANLIDMGSGNYQARMPLGSQRGGVGFFRMEFQLKQ